MAEGKKKNPFKDTIRRVQNKLTGVSAVSRTNALEYLLRDGAGGPQYIQCDPFMEECVRPVHPKEDIHWDLWNGPPANAFRQKSVCEGTLGQKAPQDPSLTVTTRSELYTAPEVQLEELLASNRDVGEAQEKALLQALKSGAKLSPEQLDILEGRGHHVDRPEDSKRKTTPSNEMPVLRDLQESTGMTLQDLDFGGNEGVHVDLCDVDVADKPSEGIYSAQPHPRFPMITCEQYHQIDKTVRHKHVIMPRHEAHVAKLQKENPGELATNNSTLVKETVRYVVEKAGHLRNVEEKKFLARFIQTKPPFQKLDLKTLIKHVEPITLRCFKSGQVVYLEGQPFCGVHYLLQGKLVNFSPDVRSGGVLRAFHQGQMVGADEGTDMRVRELSCRADDYTLTVFLPRQSWCALWASLQRLNNVSHDSMRMNTLSLSFRRAVGERTKERFCQIATERVYARSSLISSRVQVIEERRKMGLLGIAGSEHESEADEATELHVMVPESESRKSSVMSLRKSTSRQSRSSIFRSNTRQSQESRYSQESRHSQVLSKLGLPHEYVKVIISGTACIKQNGCEIGIVSAGDRKSVV